MNLLRYKWLTLDILVDKESTRIVMLRNYGKYIIQPKKQNHSSVTIVSPTHTGPSLQLWWQRHLRTLRSGADQAHRLPEAPVPRHERVSKNSAAHLPRSRHSLPTSTLINTLDGSLTNRDVKSSDRPRPRGQKTGLGLGGNGLGLETLWSRPRVVRPRGLVYCNVLISCYF